jgi:HAE1 family hydrophobic/amphiphilic exporter-1
MVLIIRLTLLKVNIKIYLEKIINRRAITFIALVFLCRTWLISTVLLDLSQMRIKDVLCYYSNTPGSSLERTNDISVKLQKNSRRS